MLFFVNPGEDEISQIVFIYFNSFLESFQVICLNSGAFQRQSEYNDICVGGFLFFWGGDKDSVIVMMGLGND